MQIQKWKTLTVPPFSFCLESKASTIVNVYWKPLLVENLNRGGLVKSPENTFWPGTMPRLVFRIVNFSSNSGILWRKLGTMLLLTNVFFQESPSGTQDTSANSTNVAKVLYIAMKIYSITLFYSKRQRSHEDLLPCSILFQHKKPFLNVEHEAYSNTDSTWPKEPVKYLHGLMNFNEVLDER